MNNIILIGFMGCGKSSVGHGLSRCLDMKFTDTDRKIEKEQQRTIAEIFAKEGEPYFRKLETKALEALLIAGEDGVISVGGGLPIMEENRKLLRELGCTIYLKVTAKTVFERLKNDTARPLLKGDNPQGKIRELLEKRTDFYQEAADYAIDTDGKALEQIIDEIREVVKEYENTCNQRTES